MSRLSQFVRKLRSQVAESRGGAAALQIGSDPAQWGHARLVSTDPLIVMRPWKRDTPQPDIMTLMPAALRTVPFHLLIVPFWSLENLLELDQLGVTIDRALESHPGIKPLVLCNTEREASLVAARGIAAVFVNHNAFADERVFQPIAGQAPRFDAIYNATFLDWKRHPLAAGIDRLALIGYLFHPEQTATALAAVRAALPKAEVVNRVVDGRLEWLDPAAVNRALNQARVGLCLSAEEGAMFASIEYLLAGLPVVSTPSIGGRDVFFDPDFSMVVEPDASAVRDAVRLLISRDIPRALVRARTLKRLSAHRERFCRVVQSILDAHGTARDFASEWPDHHRHQWLEWVEFHAFWRSIVSARSG